MKKTLNRFLALLLSLIIVFGIIVPTTMVSETQAANLSTYLYQLPSNTLNSSGKYRQNMSYVIKTRNGKIIVIDGGYVTEDSDAEYLLSFLQDITGKTVPNVDAWFFTHPHADHIGAFEGLAERHASEITVDTIYYNFPSDEQVETYCPSGSVSSTINAIKNFESLIPNIKKADGTAVNVVEILARHQNKCRGSFAIDTVHFDILLTCEDVFAAAETDTTLYSGTLSTNGKAYTNQTIKQLLYDDFGNNTSCVIRMTVGGKNVLFLGDLAEPGGIVLRSYHDANAANTNKYFNLKSDIVQMAHHGQNAVAKNVYEAIDPDICLWPSPNWVYNAGSSSTLTTYYTKQWISELGATSYVSMDGPQTIDFPDIRSDTAVEIPEELKPLIFDATYYADKYADVKKAFGTDETKLYNHFINYGIEEGRCASPFFDLKYYMAQNSQKLHDYCKGEYLKGFAHFLKYVYEPSELSAAKKFSPLFDCKYYYKNNSDLSSMTTEFEVLQHFVNIGYAEGRLGSQEVITLDNRVYHTAKSVSAVDVTCTTNGYAAGKICSTCGESLEGRAVTPAPGHSFDKNVCSVCGYDRGYVLLHFQDGAPELDYIWEMNQGTLGDNPFVSGDAHGAFEGYILNGSDAYLKMTDGDLDYELIENDIVQIRVQLSNEESDVLLSNTGSSTGTLVFDQNFKAFLQTSENYSYSGTYCTTTTASDDLEDGKYGIVNLTMKEVCYGTTLEKIRIDFLDGYGQSATGTFRLDYIYVGPLDTAPVIVEVLDTNGETLYSRYHGYGTSVTETLPTLEKAADEASHYTFSGWQNEAGESVDPATYAFVADTVLTPYFAGENHNYVTTDNADGSRSSVCEDCGYTAICTHEWDEGTITTAPTCTENGIKTFTCICGAGYTEEVEAAGHKKVTDDAVAPTCNETGLTEGSHCSVCGEVIIAQEEVSALGHVEVIDAAIAPTCTESGLTEGKHCSVCGETLLAQNEVAALGHSYNALITAPTCEAIGYTTYTCAICNDTYEADVVAALGHNYDGGVITKEPTCTQEGIKTFTCPCGDSYTESIQMIDHDEVIDAAVNATCTQKGLTEGAHCSVCGKVLIEQNILPTLAHEAEILDYLAPTCTENGHYEHYVCSICGNIFADVDCIYELPSEYVIITATGHNYNMQTVAATCTEDGYILYTCSACGDSYTTNGEAAFGHTYVCNDNGDNHIVSCSNCNYSATEEHSYVDGACVCGAVEATEPEYELDTNLSFIMSISAGAEMQVRYTILNAKVSSFESFYLVVTKAVADGEPVVTTFELDAMTPVTNTNGTVTAYQATYAGINAKEMGDEFATVLYAVASDGTIHYSATNTNSMKSYLIGKIDAESSIAELKTMCVDMLNYGAAAQIRLDYNTGNLVNADLTEEQKALATQEIPEAVNNISTTTDGSKLISSVSLQSKVLLYLNSNYAGTDASTLKYVIKDAESGETLDTLDVTKSGNFRQAVYSNVGAKQMRQLLTIALYDGDTAVSQTLTWSIESYVASVRAKTTATEAELNIVNAMLTYGDSVAAYMTASGQ